MQFSSSLYRCFLLVLFAIRPLPEQQPPIAIMPTAAKVRIKLVTTARQIIYQVIGDTNKRIVRRNAITN